MRSTRLVWFVALAGLVAAFGCKVEVDSEGDAHGSGGDGVGGAATGGDSSEGGAGALGGAPSAGAPGLGGAAGAAGAAWTPAPNAFTFDVEWGEATTVVGEDDLDLLLSHDLAAGSFTFDEQAVLDAGLDLSPDRVLVVHGLEVGRIIDAVPNGTELVITTEPASIAEAVANGTIGWDYQVAFRSDVVSFVQVDAGAGAPTRSLIGGVSGSRIGPVAALPDGTGGTGGEDWTTLAFSYDPYDYELKFKLAESRLDLDFTVKKELVAPAVAEFGLKGTLESFRSTGDIEIVDHQLTRFGYGADGLRGEAVVSLRAAASGTDLNYQLPKTLISVPILVGGIPVNVDVAVLFVVNGVVPVDGSASVQARFSYSGDTGFNFDGTDVAANVGLTNEPPVQEGAEEPFAASSANISANFGLAFPRIEVGIARSSIAGWVQSAYLVGSSFTTNNTLIPVCLEANAEYIAAMGYKLSVLDVYTLAEGSETLIDEKVTLARSGECPAQ